MGIVNPGMLQIYDEIPENLRNLVTDVVLNRRKDATERLLLFAEQIVDDGHTKNIVSENGVSYLLRNVLEHALIKGITEYIEIDVEEARKHLSSAIDVIEIPLMNGMNIVGDLLAREKCFCLR